MSVLVEVRSYGQCAWRVLSTWLCVADAVEAANAISRAGYESRLRVVGQVAS